MRSVTSADSDRDPGLITKLDAVAGRVLGKV
jgi:hypothetical protein